VLLRLGRKQHSCVQGHSFCLHYTLCLMQLSVVRNLILVGCSDDIPMGGLLVIDAVGWRSMYFVVMPRVNLIVILMTYAHCLYSINCPTVICLPSMLLFILWRDTTSELWTPLQFPLHCYTHYKRKDFLWQITFITENATSITYYSLVTKIWHHQGRHESSITDSFIVTEYKSSSRKSELRWRSL
jgi:hypothetical protein